MRSHSTAAAGPCDRDSVSSRDVADRNPQSPVQPHPSRRLRLSSRESITGVWADSGELDALATGRSGAAGVAVESDEGRREVARVRLEAGIDSLAPRDLAACRPEQTVVRLTPRQELPIERRRLQQAGLQDGPRIVEVGLVQPPHRTGVIAVEERRRGLAKSRWRAR